MKYKLKTHNNIFLNSCVVMLLSILVVLSSLSVTAATTKKQPTKKKSGSEIKVVDTYIEVPEYKMQLSEYTTNGTATITKVENANNEYVLTAKPKDNYIFDHWEITGGYLIIKGKIQSKDLSVNINSDCVVNPCFRIHPKILNTTSVDKAKQQTKNNDIIGKYIFYGLLSALVILIIVYILLFLAVYFPFQFPLFLLVLFLFLCLLYVIDFQVV